MDTQRVLCETVHAVARLTLNHPEKRNALSSEMLRSLRAELVRLREDRRVRVVVLRANGPVFSSGHDLRELAAADAGQAQAIFALCTEVMELIRQLPQPVIAQVHALATAAGCQLVATCDLVVAAEEAKFAAPGVKIGLFCATPAVPLSRSVMPKKALEMLFTGEPITAQEAERAGLVNRVVPASELEAATLALAEQIAQYSGQVLALGKRSFYEQLHLNHPQAYELAQACIVENVQQPDAREGINAFLEKRKPVWEIGGR